MIFARLRREAKASSSEKNSVASCSKSHRVMSFAFFGILKIIPKRSHAIYSETEKGRFKDWDGVPFSDLDSH